MLETDFILMFTAGYLLAPENLKEKALADFDIPYELRSVKLPGKVSIGGTLNGSEALSWKEWTENLRSEIPQQLQVCYVANERSKLPAHIAAAFAGSVSFALTLTTSQRHETWYLRSQSSRRAEISSGQFAAFIDSQPASQILWRRVEQLINESNAMNDQPPVPAGQTAGYLHSDEGEAIFDFLGDNLMSEIQVECVVTGSTLLFAPEWEPFFDLPNDDLFDFAPAVDGKESVYFYLLGPVSANELSRIVAAQPFAKKIFPALNLLLQNNPEPGLKISSGAEELLKMGTNEQLQTLGSLVCRVIISCCEEDNIFPEIPPGLEHVFGPDETDQLRARARGHIEKFRHLKPMATPWRYYEFQTLTNFQLPEPAETAELFDRAFRTTLEAITLFAENHESPYFNGIFRLAAYIISPEVLSDTFMTAEIPGLAKEKGFDKYLDWLDSSLFHVSQMAAMNWPAKKCYGILAALLTKVFGGMGSWNDQYFNEDDALFQKVTADFFRAHEQYFALQLSHDVIPKQEPSVI